MSFWEFRCACDGYDDFHAGKPEPGLQAPTMEEFEAVKARAPTMN